MGGHKRVRAAPESDKEKRHGIADVAEQRRGGRGQPPAAALPQAVKDVNVEDLPQRIGHKAGDGDARDEKIIAVPLGDPNYNYMFDISQLPEHLLDEIRHFFTVYKELEGRTTVVSKAQNREVANRIIVECINNYNESFGKKDKDKKNKDESKKG